MNIRFRHLRRTNVTALFTAPAGAMILLAMLLPLTGCGLFVSLVTEATQFLVNPKVQVVAARVTEKTKDGVRIELTLKVTNPNTIELPLEKIHYTVTVPNGKTFTFVDGVHRTLPAKGEQTFTIAAAFADPLALRRSASAWRSKFYTLTGRISYRPPGELRNIAFNSGIPLPSTPVNKRARLVVGSAGK